jgi:UDP-2-acetamido-2-deoxy-ribo-hexuluronate aminotransferase
MGSDKYENVRIGLNGRLDTLQAAVLLEKLTIFDEELELRNKVALRYNAGLRRKFVVPEIKNDRTSVWAQYSILSQDRAADMERLKKAGVPTSIYYPKPLHMQKAFDYLGYKSGELPVCEDIAGKIFSLPMHPYLQNDEQDFIIETCLAG